MLKTIIRSLLITNWNNKSYCTAFRPINVENIERLRNEVAIRNGWASLTSECEFPGKQNYSEPWKRFFFWCVTKIVSGNPFVEVLICPDAQLQMFSFEIWWKRSTVCCLNWPFERLTNGVIKEYMEPVFLYHLLDSHSRASILVFCGCSLKLASTKHQARSTCVGI